MQNELEQLKKNSVGKLKAYNEPIKENQLAMIGDLLCSYVIEDSIIKQAVLTVSHKDKIDFKVPDELKEEINKVFGMETIVFKRTYPNRGRCIQFVFGVQQ